MSFKTCTTCNQVKTTLQFQVRSDNTDGLHTRCNPCESAYQAERRARKAAEVPVDAIGDAMHGWKPPRFPAGAVLLACKL